MSDCYLEQGKLNTEEYRRARNGHKGFSQVVKRGYFRAAFTEVGNDPKRLQKLVMGLFGNNKSKNRFQKINGKDTDMSMTNEINNFFVDIGPRSAEQIPNNL